MHVFATDRNKAVELWGKLSPRQEEVALLIAEGKSRAEIADALKIALRTVDVHWYAVRKKLEVNSNGVAIIAFAANAHDWLR